MTVGLVLGLKSGSDESIISVPAKIQTSSHFTWLWLDGLHTTDPTS